MGTWSCYSAPDLRLPSSRLGHTLPQRGAAAQLARPAAASCTTSRTAQLISCPLQLLSDVIASVQRMRRATRRLLPRAQARATSVTPCRCAHCWRRTQTMRCCARHHCAERSRHCAPRGCAMLARNCRRAASALPRMHVHGPQVMLRTGSAATSPSKRPTLLAAGRRHCGTRHLQRNAALTAPQSLQG